MSPLMCAALVVFLEVLSFGAIFPVLPDYCEQLGATHGNVGLWTGVMFMLVGGPRVVTNVMWGKCSDRIGRKPTLALITGGTMTGSLLWGMSGSLWMLAMSRLVAGVFQAQAALTGAIVADVREPQHRAAGMGLLGAAFGFGMLGGIIMGGLVGTHISLGAVGYASALGQLASLAVIVLLLRETHPHHGRGAREKESTPDVFETTAVRHLLGDRTIASLLMVVLAMTAGSMVLVPTLRLLTDRWYGFDLRESTWALAAWMLVGVVVQGGAVRPMVRRMGERGTIMVGLPLLASGLLWMGLQPAEWGFWSAAMLVAAGSGLATPALSGLISHAVKPGDQGAAQGLNQSATALGRTIAYAMAGAMYQFISPGAPLLAGAGLTIVAAGVLAARRRR